MNRSPGVAIGMQNATANGFASSVSGGKREMDGTTASSSANGASVASMRAPRITAPASVSRTTRAAFSPSAATGAAVARSRCGWTSVCVRQRSRRRTVSW